MARLWKEPYSIEKARELAIREFEGGIIVHWGIVDWGSGILGNGSERPDAAKKAAKQVGYATEHSILLYGLAVPEWIYYVHVCGFTFAFYSLEMIQAFLDYYSTKILPSRAQDAPHCNNDLRQNVFNRLPLYLREEPKRQKVVKALQRALKEFGAEINTGPKR